MNSTQIAAFIDRLTEPETIEAIAHGLSQLPLDGMINAILQGMDNDDLAELRDRITDHLAETGPVSDDEDPDA